VLQGAHQQHGWGLLPALLSNYFLRVIDRRAKLLERATAAVGFTPLRPTPSVEGP
jgi:hypothetical protein